MHGTTRVRSALFVLLLLLLVACAAETARARQRLIGEVTGIDAATGQITVRAEGGASVTFATNAETVFRRVPPGQTTLDRAERITRADVAAGDRVLVPNGAPADGKAVRQLIVMSRAALAETGERAREDWRRRGVAGRVVSADAAKREAVVETRGREGVETLTVVAAPEARIRRYAPDSLRPADAVAGAFADIRAGDQIRALGDRSADGRRLAAEEVISGSVARLTGVVASIDAARGEIAVKAGPTNETVTVALGARTTVRRVPADFAETLRARREKRRERRGQPGEGAAGARREGDGTDGERRRERRGQRNAGGGQRGGAGGGGLQQMLDSLPAVTIAELKTGDAVIVTGTAGPDAARVAAATILTGGPEVISLLQRRGPPGGRGEMSPGLPGAVMGGGTGGDRDEPRD